MIPCDADRSGIPVVVLRFVLINPTGEADRRERSAEISRTSSAGTVCRERPRKLQRIPRQARHARLRGLFMQSQIDREIARVGNAGADDAPQGRHVSHRVGGSELGRHAAGLVGRFQRRRQARQSRRQARAAVRIAGRETNVPANGVVEHHVSDHLAFSQSPGWNPPHERMGNYYTTQYRRRVGCRGATVPQLETASATRCSSSRASSKAICRRREGGGAVQRIDAAHADLLSPPKTGDSSAGKVATITTAAATASCTHVWNYEQATAFLYRLAVAIDARSRVRPRHARQRHT